MRWRRTPRWRVRLLLGLHMRLLAAEGIYTSAHGAQKCRLLRPGVGQTKPVCCALDLVHSTPPLPGVSLQWTGSPTGQLHAHQVVCCAAATQARQCAAAPAFAPASLFMSPYRPCCAAKWRCLCAQRSHLLHCQPAVQAAACYPTLTACAVQHLCCICVEGASHRRVFTCVLLNVHDMPK